MEKCVKFPSIDQLRSVIRNVKNKASFAGLDENGNAIYKQVLFPTLTFLGTVKLHGTNSSVRQNTKTSDLVFQSRERVITPLDDNAGFATAMYSIGEKLVDYMNNIRSTFSIPDDVALTVYGEWCGGNIQKNVAINGLPKMMVVFAVRVGLEEDTVWYRANDLRFNVVSGELLHDTIKIYAINKFETYEVTVDFNAPEASQNKFIELTLAVEKECPVGKYFGKEGIGEGIVFSIVDPGYEDSGFIFKSKGELHSASKVKTIAAVDVEKVTKIKELVDLIMTENRMEQMISVLKDREGLEAEPKNLGNFIRLCMQDAFKEELDTIIQNGFEAKEFSKFATVKVRTWFLSKLE